MTYSRLASTHLDLNYRPYMVGIGTFRNWLECENLSQNLQSLIHENKVMVKMAYKRLTSTQQDLTKDLI